jgi:hypothetical protein
MILEEEVCLEMMMTIKQKKFSHNHTNKKKIFLKHSRGEEKKVAVA